MISYRIDTMDYTSKPYTELEEAKKVFEETKDTVMSDGVDYDSYVELVVSEDDFETETTLIRVIAVEDEEKFITEGSPRDKGYDYDWWATWAVVDN